MQAFKRAFTFRRKKRGDKALVETGNNKPHQWNDDERKVRDGNCSFQVKYLGSIEVFESRGMAVCEEAMKQLLKHKIRRKSKRAVLYVSGDALRVTEEISKGLIVDQVIEKVSFCAPVRNHPRGFAYICRDATTRRWLCHGFKAVKETGERLSHAVGCAFAVCLEKKQQREKDAVDVTFNENKTSFTRLGSFKQAPMSERWRDPQSVIIPEPVVTNAKTGTNDAGDVDSSKNNNESASFVPRPHASQSALERQSSLRIFPKLQDQNTPFKRDYSVRISELTSNVDRKQKPLSATNVGHSIQEDSDELSRFSNGDNTNERSTISPSLSMPSKLTTAAVVSAELDSFGATTNNNNNNFNIIKMNQSASPVTINNIDINNNTNSNINNPFSPALQSDPFSAAPINPSIHFMKNQNNESKPFQHSPNNQFYSSMRPTSNRNPPHSYFRNVPSVNNNTNINNNSNLFASFNNNHHSNISTNWSSNLLEKPQPNTTTITTTNSAKISHYDSANSNPFDVSWVTNQLQRSNLTNGGSEADFNNNRNKHNPFI